MSASGYCGSPGTRPCKGRTVCRVGACYLFTVSAAEIAAANSQLKRRVRLGDRFTHDATCRTVFAPPLEPFRQRCTGNCIGLAFQKVVTRKDFKNHHVSPSQRRAPSESPGIVTGLLFFLRTRAVGIILKHGVHHEHDKLGCHDRSSASLVALGNHDRRRLLLLPPFAPLAAR